MERYLVKMSKAERDEQASAGFEEIRARISLDDAAAVVAARTCPSH